MNANLKRILTLKLTIKNYLYICFIGVLLGLGIANLSEYVKSTISQITRQMEIGKMPAPNGEFKSEYKHKAEGPTYGLEK